MKKKIIILVIILLLGAGVYYYLQTTKNKQDENVLSLYGNVDIREVNLGFRIPGRIKTMKLEEGESAKAGEIIAYLDHDQYQDDVRVAKAEVGVQSAQLEKLQAGTRSEEIAQARSSVEEKKASLLNAETIMKRNKAGVEAGAISRQEYDSSVRHRDEALARLNTAQEVLAEARNGPRIEDIKAARASLNASKAQMANAQKKISYTSLISPSDGVILTRVLEPGAYVMAGESVYTLSINSPKWIQAYVDEVNLGKIYPGMYAEIKTDSYPDKVYSGHIGFISPVAEFTPKTVETEELRTSLVYRLKVIVKDADNELRQGMPVTVNLDTIKNKNGAGKNVKITGKDR